MFNCNVHMLNWMCAHAQLKVCKCSIGSVHMLNWRHAKLKRPHAQLKCARADVYMFTMHMLTGNYAYAQLGVCTCSSEVCTCSTSVCTCWCVGVGRAHTHLKACVCSPGSVHMREWSVYTLHRSVPTLRWGVHVLERTTQRDGPANPEMLKFFNYTFQKPQSEIKTALHRWQEKNVIHNSNSECMYNWFCIRTGNVWISHFKVPNGRGTGRAQWNLLPGNSLRSRSSVPRMLQPSSKLQSRRLKQQNSAEN